MNNIKIAFIDIDGTLTNSKQIITDETKAAIKYLKDNGVIIVITSGRWDEYILNYNKDIPIDYIIANNGALIYDNNKKEVIHEEFIDSNDLNLIYDYCTKNNITIINNCYFNRTKNIINNVYQNVILCNSINEVDDFIKYIDTLNNSYISYISYSYYKKLIKNSYTLNINNKSTNKGISIRILLDYLHINKENSICFGDNINDIEMFNNVGIKVCMGNSNNDLKNIADYVTLTNDENGIAYFVNKYIKNRED